MEISDSGLILASAIEVSVSFSTALILAFYQVYLKEVSQAPYYFQSTSMTCSPLYSFIMLSPLQMIRMLQTNSRSIQLQQDLDSLSGWSNYWNIFFNSSKFIHLSFNTKFPTSYFINGHQINKNSTHRDLQQALSFQPISYGNITTVTFLTKPTKHLVYLDEFFLILETFKKKSFYLFLVRSQLQYCSQLWHPYQINDIILLERI